MIFISAGHNPKGIRKDPGAVANGLHEADLAVEFRDLIGEELKILGVKFITDYDEETLGEYLKRIQTGNGSVVAEYHFDAAESATATGTTVLVEEESDRLDKAFAKELVDSVAKCYGIKNRGIKSEADSHRGRLGLMREEGIIALVELGFLTNIIDLQAHQFYKRSLAKIHAEILQRYDKMI